MNHESKSYERHAELFQSFDGPCSVLTYCRYAPGSVFCNVQHSICIRGGYLIYSWKIYQWRSQRSNRQSWNPVLCRRLNESCKKEKSGCRIRITCQLSDLAFIATAKKEKKAATKAQVIPATLTASLVGVTEPLEFMFMFCALPLYLVYAVLQGCAFAMAGIIHLRLHSFGNLEFLTRIPMSIRAGLGGDVIHFVICIAVFFAAGYAIAYFMIGKFHFATPGRLGNYTDDGAEEEDQGSTQTGSKEKKDSQAERIIALLGGRENIVLVDACMTRLRVTVKDVDKVAELPAWKAEGALGLLKKDGGIQAVYGPKADVLKSDINDIL